MTAPSKFDIDFQNISAEEQLKAGVTPGYVRLCVGIEHAEDIIEDLKIGLEAASKATATAAA